MTQDIMQDITSVDAPMLQIGNLTKTFGGFTALDNISVDIRKGERFGLIGPNGSGKTTLINCISGALRQNVGSVMFCGEDITQLPPHLRAARVPPPALQQQASTPPASRGAYVSHYTCCPRHRFPDIGNRNRLLFQALKNHRVRPVQEARNLCDNWP